MPWSQRSLYSDVVTTQKREHQTTSLVRHTTTFDDYVCTTSERLHESTNFVACRAPLQPSFWHPVPFIHAQRRSCKPTGSVAVFVPCTKKNYLKKTIKTIVCQTSGQWSPLRGVIGRGGFNGFNDLTRAVAARPLAGWAPWPPPKKFYVVTTSSGRHALVPTTSFSDVVTTQKRELQTTSLGRQTTTSATYV